MTVLLTVFVGIPVFLVSLIITKFDFKTSLIRLAMCILVGFVIDCLLAVYFTAAMYGYPL